MSSGTLSSDHEPSAGPSTIKRAHVNGVEIEERSLKRPRVSQDDATIKRDPKDKKKRTKKKKRKLPVVVVEDGRARFKDSRRGLSEPSSPSLKAGEPSLNRSPPAILAEERPAEEVSEEERLVEDIVTSSQGKGREGSVPHNSSPLQIIDKGKGKAADLHSADDEIARLTKELADKNELINKHQNAVAQTQQAITCQICLELMYKPFALSPCGHIACYDCLVSWFKAPSLEDDHGPEAMPVTLRKKTCPHCRAIIRDRPVQVWGFKDIVDTFARSGLLQGNFLYPDETNESSNTNGESLWNGIFYKSSRQNGEFGEDNLEFLGGLGGAGLLDEEDGGIYRCYDCLHEIWDGVCSHCHREYPAPGLDDEDDDDDFGSHELGSDDDDEDDNGYPGDWRDFIHPVPAHVVQQMQAAIHRANTAAAPGEGGHNLRGAWIEGNIADVVDDDDDEAAYESSFIDDDNDAGRTPPRPFRARSNRQPRIRRESVIELSSDSDDETSMRLRDLAAAHRAPAAVEVVYDDDDEAGDLWETVRPRVRGQRTIIVSDEEEDEDEDAPGPSTRQSGSRSAAHTTSGRNRQRIVSSDEEEDDDIDPTLAERVATQERELYGEDDFVQRRFSGSFPTESDAEDHFHTYEDEDDSASDEGLYEGDEWNY